VCAGGKAVVSSGLGLGLRDDLVTSLSNLRYGLALNRRRGS
jgi:hypothetical protein